MFVSIIFNVVLIEKLQNNYNTQTLFIIMYYLKSYWFEYYKHKNYLYLSVSLKLYLSS
jgi:hypothetical protein